MRWQSTVKVTVLVPVVAVALHRSGQTRALLTSSNHWTFARTITMPFRPLPSLANSSPHPQGQV